MAAKNTPFLVGLTGQTGAGKTTVSRAFADEGFVIIDCDRVTRELQARPEVIGKLAETFGPMIVAEDGSLDRKALAAIAFADEEQTQKLGNVMYPIITAEIDRRIDEAVQSGKNRILLDAPTLFESGIDKRCQKKVAVLAAEELRLFRIIRRDGITEEQARARMKAQHKDGWYTVRCDYTLRNNGTEEELYKQGKFLAAGLVPNKKHKTSHEVRTTIIALALTLGTIGFVSGGYHLIYRFMYPQKYQETVTACAEEFGLDEELIYAVISCESGFDPQAVSPVEAKGLMQLTEDAFDWVQFRLGEEMSYDDIFDPEVNIRCGSAMLSLLKEELGDERSAVAAYHSGLNQVKEWLADPEYSDDGKWLDTIPAPLTREYVDKVSNTKSVYENLYD